MTANNQQLVDPGALLKVSSLAKRRRVSRTVIYKEIAEKKLTAVLIDGTPHVIQKGAAR